MTCTRGIRGTDEVDEGEECSGKGRVARMPPDEGATESRPDYEAQPERRAHQPETSSALALARHIFEKKK